MEFHFRLMDVLPGLDSVGGVWVASGWLVGFEVGVRMFRRPPRFWPTTSAPEEKGDEGRGLAVKLKDRVEQRRFFSSSSSTLPPGLAAIINHGRAIGEEGLGFWALKSERG